MYTADLLQLVKSHELHPHLFADDTQIYGFCRPGDTTQLQESVSACIDKVASWMRSNRLQLNTAKTDFLWCTSPRRQHQLPTNPLTIGSDVVPPARSVRDLGIYVDSDLSMSTHVAKTVSSCFAALRQLRSIRRSVTRQVLLSLVTSFVLSRLNYGLATLAGLPARQLNRLQSVLNAAARLICGARKHDHITPLLRDLHWLRVPERIQFRLSQLVYRCLHGLAPQYLASQFTLAASVQSRQCLTSPLIINAAARRAVYEARDDRRPCLPSGCGTRLEQIAIISRVSAVTSTVQKPTENASLQTVLSIIDLPRHQHNNIHATRYAT